MRLVYTWGMHQGLNGTSLMRGIMLCCLALCLGACSKSTTSGRLDRDVSAYGEESGPVTCVATSCEGLCCESSCVNPATDVGNCGACGVICTSNEVCTSGICLCIPGTEGCEDPVEEEDCELTDSCPCTVGEEQPCYDGPEGTLGIGACLGGTQVCSSAGWSPCVGQVLPSPEDCAANEIDEDCNGTTDDDGDFDGDGWTGCGGDCCDSQFDTCPQPALVNPGAYDFINEYDDDCDGEIDNPQERDCSSGTITNNVSSTDLIEGLDLCTTTTLEGDTWGVISSELLRANGVGSPSPLQVGVLTAFGSLIPPPRQQYSSDSFFWSCPWRE